MTNRKGIILAGGSGTRLQPLTTVLSKQLMPIYDKPMIFYPLSVLMLADIREILIIVTERDLPMFKRLLGNGNQFGITLTYALQDEPNGIAEALIIAEDYLDGCPSALILGDNLFYGSGFKKLLREANENLEGATIFAQHVADPHRYGVVKFDEKRKAELIVEKPDKAISDYAVTGLYFFDENAGIFARKIKPSFRGELEITDVLNCYLDINKLNVSILGRGFNWLDTGTFDSLLEAGNFVRSISKRQGLTIGSPDEHAIANGWL